MKIQAAVCYKPPLHLNFSNLRSLPWKAEEKSKCCETSQYLIPETSSCPGSDISKISTWNNLLLKHPASTFWDRYMTVGNVSQSLQIYWALLLTWRNSVSVRVMIGVRVRVTCPGTSTTCSDPLIVCAALPRLDTRIATNLGYFTKSISSNESLWAYIRVRVRVRELGLGLVT